MMMMMMMMCDAGKAEKTYGGRAAPVTSHRRARFLLSAQKSLHSLGIRLIKIAIRKIQILDKQINAKLATQASIRVTRLEKLDTAEVGGCAPA